MTKKRTSRVTKRTSRVTNKRRYRGGSRATLIAHLNTVNRVIVDILNHIPESSGIKETASYEQLVEDMEYKPPRLANWQRGAAPALRLWQSLNSFVKSE
uniref:Uncharacterized protein n=1 Tax=viral metagenome TaxID=1070528 RepID=A0A6C0CFJ0_9ZZZZ